MAWTLTSFGAFWPGWILGIWGVLLALDVWYVYYQRPVTEDEIDQELLQRH